MFEAHNIDILFLQKTHCTNIKECKLWERSFNGKCFWAFGDNHSRGVGIIIKVGLNYKVSRFDYGPNGRLLILDLRIANVEYRLINVYMPNNPRERKEFITQLSVFCNTSRNVIYGGTLIL